MIRISHIATRLSRKISSFPSKSCDLSIKVVDLINTFRNRGHFAANLDPLGSGRKPFWLPQSEKDFPDVVSLLKDYPHSLDLRRFHLQSEDLDSPVDLGQLPT